MPDNITGRRLGELLSQLCAALGKPFGTKGEKMLPGYLKGLEDWPEEAIEWAIWRACKTWTAKAFPKPAELAALCAQSPHRKLEPEGPKEPVVPEAERCRECGEWWGWHRIASLAKDSPHLVWWNGIRHRGECPRAKAQEDHHRVYRWSWIDGQAPAGRLQAGEKACDLPGVLQLILPVPPLPEPPKKRSAAERLEAHQRRQPTPIGEVLVTAPTDAGDAWEPAAKAATL